MLFFFFNDTATTEIYTLSLHDALPISGAEQLEVADRLDERVVEVRPRVADPLRLHVPHPVRPALAVALEELAVGDVLAREVVRARDRHALEVRRPLLLELAVADDVVDRAQPGVDEHHVVLAHPGG